MLLEIDKYSHICMYILTGHQISRKCLNHSALSANEVVTSPANVSSFSFWNVSVVSSE